jgi:hypothetical protein
MKKSAKKRDARIYNKGVFLLCRYLICIIISFNNLFLFYFIFTPLTIYPVFFLLNLFFKAFLVGNIITIGRNVIRIGEPCVAGAAYYLLFLLHFLTPMKLKKRIFLILYSFIMLLVFNIIRIFLFSIFFVNSFSFFNKLHLFVWYFLSVLVVFIIWVSEVRIFKIKEIPLFSDIKFIIQLVKNSK